MINGFNVIAIRIQDKGRIVSRVIGSDARFTIVTAAGFHSNFVKCLHSFFIMRLKCKVHASGQFPVRSATVFA